MPLARLQMHADTDVVGLNSGKTGKLVLRVITNAHTVASQRLCKLLYVEHGRLIGYPAPGSSRSCISSRGTEKHRLTPPR